MRATLFKTAAALAIAAACYAAGAAPQYGSLRSSGQYEAALRSAGLPISGGLAWNAPGAKKASAPAPALRSSGQYESALRSAGLPLSGGQAWTR